MKLKPEQEMRLYEWYARHVWPFHRIFVRNKLSKRCTACAVSENFSPLIHGLCEPCRNHETRIHGPSPEERKRMSTELDTLFEKYSGKGKEQFDCLLLFSGGKDSIYLLHILRTRFPKLRILLLLVDNTFLPPEATANASAVAQKLRVPYIATRPSPSFYEKVFRHAFLTLGQKHSNIGIDQFDGDILFDVARNYAVRQAIPLIVSGVTAIQVEQYAEIKNYETPRSIEEGKRTHIAGQELASFLDKDELAYFWDGTQWPKKSIPRMIYPFYAWNYTEKDVVKTLNKLGLLKKKKSSPLSTNHQLIPLMGAVDIARFGYSSYEPEFANLIRAGGADPKFWRAIFEMQEYAMKTNTFVKGSVDIALKRLSLTRKDLSLPE